MRSQPAPLGSGSRSGAALAQGRPSSDHDVVDTPGSIPAQRDGGPPAFGPLATERDGVLTIKEATAAGFTRTEIRRRVEDGAWRLYTGDVLVTRPGPLTLIQRLWCALASIGPDALLGGASAAALGGLRGCAEPWLTVILASGRRVTQRPGVKIRATARLGPEDLSADGWPPRTGLPRSLIDMAEWSANHDEARVVLAVAVASGIVESDEVRAALARRGPIARRQVIGDALDDLDAGAPWVPALLYRRVAARHQLPAAAQGRPDSRAAARLDLRYDAFRVRVEIGDVAAPGIRTATRLVEASPLGVAGPWRLPRAAPADWVVVRVPLRLLREEPDRVGVAVATALRQRGWSARAPLAPARVTPLGHALDPALDQALGPDIEPPVPGFAAYGHSAGPIEFDVD